jgi:hypothetical protein
MYGEKKTSVKKEGWELRCGGPVETRVLDAEGGFKSSCTHQVGGGREREALEPLVLGLDVPEDRVDEEAREVAGLVEQEGGRQVPHLLLRVLGRADQVQDLWGAFCKGYTKYMW